MSKVAFIGLGVMGYPMAGHLKAGGHDVTVYNRTKAKADELAEDFGVRCVDWEARMDEAPGLICNTTPLGMSGDMEGLTPWDGDRFPEGCIAYDIVYNPLQTRFLREAEEAGCSTISGLEMASSAAINPPV